MDDAKTRWALLVGINLYATRPLRGCVNDVNIMKSYLESDIIRTQTTILTANQSTDPKSQQPAEDPATWPTLLNIRSGLEDIISGASPGDLVYIHYSGHGIRLPTPAHLPYGHKNTGDVALVVLDDSASAQEEIHGFLLANILKRMVAKGLFVTLALDCCFSGHVYRQDVRENGAIRTLDPIFELHPPSAYENCSETAQRGFRDVQPLPRWLVNPEGYRIIAACGPQETAHERVLNGKHHGVLSYHLHQSLLSLRNNGTQISHQTFHDNLVTLVHSTSAHQTPTHSGTQKYSFFAGISGETLSNFMSVSGRGQQQFVLEAGKVHGVCRGDEYAIYPFAAPEDGLGVSSGLSFKAKVSSAGPITSILEPFDALPARSALEGGWKTRALTRCSERQVDIGLMPSIRNKHGWALAYLGRPSFQVAEEPFSRKPCQFFVEANNEHCRILDSDRRDIPSILPIPIDTNAGLQSVMDIFEHLAAFRFTEGIQNTSRGSASQRIFRLSLEDNNGSFYCMDNVLDIAESQDLTLTITNLGNDYTLYVTILNFTPMWQIQCLSGDGSDAGYLTIPPSSHECTGEDTLTWSMFVPELLRPHRRCEDKIKIIITSQPTSFHSLLLPKVTDLIDQRIRSHVVPSAWTPITRQPNLGRREESFYIVTLRVQTHC